MMKSGKPDTLICDYCTAPFVELEHHAAAGLIFNGVTKAGYVAPRFCFCSITCKLGVEAATFEKPDSDLATVSYDDERGGEENKALPFFEKPDDAERETTNIYRFALMAQDDPVGLIVLLLSILPGANQPKIAASFSVFHDHVRQNKGAVGISKMAVSKIQRRLINQYSDLGKMIRSIKQ